MNKPKIQLGRFLKKENWGFNFALSDDPGQKWIDSFQNVCTESGLDARVNLPSFIVELEKKNQHFVVISGGLNNSESQMREQLEEAIKKTNEKVCNQRN